MELAIFKGGKLGTSVLTAEDLLARKFIIKRRDKRLALAEADECLEQGMCVICYDDEDEEDCGCYCLCHDM